jgi:hypothetical protein
MDRKNQTKRKYFNRIKAWAELIRDIGVILSIPLVIIVGMKLYERQIEALKAENVAIQSENKAIKAETDAVKAEREIYKQTQYPQALSLMES